MSIVKYIEYFDLKSPKWAITKRVTLIILILLFLVDFFVPRTHAAFFWDHIPGFNALYGLIGCVLLIIISKALGHHFLMRKEDYYD